MASSHVVQSWFSRPPVSPEFGLMHQNVWLIRWSTIMSRSARIHFSFLPLSSSPPHSPTSSGAVPSFHRYSQLGSHTSASSEARSQSSPSNHGCGETSGP
ncbi:hypothetical protein D3C74_295370 [compost metagenome]